MGRLIILQFKGKDSSFNFKKINRSSLYGKKKRVFLDELNKECTTAIIDNSFGLLIHSGDASSVYIDEQKNFINKDDILGIDNEGNIVNRIPSTLNTSQKLQVIDEQYILDFDCSSLYHLEEEVIEKDLQISLDGGDIYSFDFNYYSDFNVEKAILLKNEKGYFALIGKETSHSWSAKEENLAEHFETPEDLDIDFEML